MGIYESGNWSTAYFEAEKDRNIDGIYKATIDGEELTFLAVSDKLYQLVDDITVTKSNIEDVTQKYELSAIIYNDIKTAFNKNTFEIRLILPKKISTETDQFTYYDYGEHRLKKILCVLTPLKNPVPFTIENENKIEQRKNQKSLDKLIKAIRTTMKLSEIHHVSAGDYLDVALQEYKTRTYISVFENGAYIMRFKCDNARWRFVLREVINDRANITYTGYYSKGNIMSANQMNDMANLCYGSSDIFAKIITDYQWINDMQEVRFESQLPI